MMLWSFTVNKTRFMLRDKKFEDSLKLYSDIVD